MQEVFPAAVGVVTLAQDHRDAFGAQQRQRPTAVFSLTQLPVSLGEDRSKSNAIGGRWTGYKDPSDPFRRTDSLRRLGAH
jgi:hypothetical protein